MDGDKTTLIDTAADVEGTLKGKDAQILGRFKGDVTLSGRVVIGEGSRVEAKVAADTAEIAGEFKGDVNGPQRHPHREGAGAGERRGPGPGGSGRRPAERRGQLGRRRQAQARRAGPAPGPVAG